MKEYVSTPDYYRDYICHYGVKGMKWGRRKGRTQSAMGADPRYQKEYLVKPGEERARLDKLNPKNLISTGPVTTATPKKTTPTTSSSSSSKSKKKGSKSSKKAVKDILSKFKLTKSSGGKKAASAKTSTKKAASSEKKSSAAKTTEKKAAAEKTETTKKSAAEKTTAANDEKIKRLEAENEQLKKYAEEASKYTVDTRYTKYLEDVQNKRNASKLTSEEVKERMKVDDERKKRKIANGPRKIFTRS